MNEKVVDPIEKTSAAIDKFFINNDLENKIFVSEYR